jgi:hypothetical protein
LSGDAPRQLNVRWTRRMTMDPRNVRVPYVTARPDSVPEALRRDRQRLDPALIDRVKGDFRHLAPAALVVEQVRYEAMLAGRIDRGGRPDDMLKAGIAAIAALLQDAFDDKEQLDFELLCARMAYDVDDLANPA